MSNHISSIPNAHKHTNGPKRIWPQKVLTCGKATLSITAIALGLIIATWPIAALAHPLADSSTETQVPAVAEGLHSEESPLDMGISMAIGRICDLAITEGDDLFKAQTEMVEDQVAKDAAESSAKAIQSAHATQAQYSISGNADKTAYGSAASPQASARTINVDGDSMSYIDTYLASTAPSSGAGLWMGSDSTTDGSWGYFIGHNPGPFDHVMDLGSGNLITVTDANGNSRTYRVVDTFTVPDTTAWEDIESRVTQHGESVVLQTCCGDNANYRIVVAA